MQNSFRLSHSILFVKNFIQVFSNFWEVIWFCSLPAFRWATRTWYHKIFSLSSIFSCFSEVFRFIITALRTACIYYHFRHDLSSTFSKVFKIFKILSKAVCFCRSVQATWLLYHKFSHLSTVNLNFLKTFLFFSISEAIPCDSLFTIPLPQGIVKHFLQKSLYFFVQIVFQHMLMQILFPGS